MKTIRDIPELQNVRVLLRIAQLANDVRLKEALVTINYLKSRGARIVLLTHVSGESTAGARAKGDGSAHYMYDSLKKYLPRLEWCPVSVGAEAERMTNDLVPGDVLLLENVRRNPGEEKNDPEFAKELAKLGDLFVQDAFDTCHRPHASIIGVPKLLPSYAGFTVEKEVNELTKALKPKSPSLAIISGAKFSTKEPVLQALLKTYDHVYVGGALANDFIKAKGYGVGASLVSDEGQDHVKELLKNPRLLIPTDAYLAPTNTKREAARVAAVDAIGASEAVLDAGPETAGMLAALAAKAKLVLWNGPLGLFEDGYLDGTRIVAAAVTHSSAYSIVGGGDTIDVFDMLGVTKDFSFVSTGGGAMLDFLANGTLPGIEALG